MSVLPSRPIRAITREPREPAPEPLIRPRVPAPLIRFDPGWLFLGVGIVTIAATVLIPAQNDLSRAHWERDKALAVERHRMERVARYGQYLSALDKHEESVVLSLAATQLNKSPADRVPMTDPADPSRTSASVFPSLEPPPMVTPPSPDAGRRVSTLERWTTNRRTRLWLLAGGIMCVLIGLLPAAKR